MIGGPDVEVTGNVLTNNHNGITFLNSVPRTGLHGWTAIRNGNVHDNTVIESGLSGAIANGDPEVLSTTIFERNVYRYTVTTGSWWFWDGMRTWAGWQSFGNDLLGAIETP